MERSEMLKRSSTALIVMVFCLGTLLINTGASAQLSDCSCAYCQTVPPWTGCNVGGGFCQLYLYLFCFPNLDLPPSSELNAPSCKKAGWPSVELPDWRSGIGEAQANLEKGQEQPTSLAANVNAVAMPDIGPPIGLSSLESASTSVSDLKP